MRNETKGSYNILETDYQGIHVRTIGEGETIVFLHGGPGGEHRFFLPHILPLSQKFRLVFYDQTGCGKSAPSMNDQYSMEDEVNVLEFLRKELKLDKLNLFGESWGSMLALLYATTYPDKVNKILLTAAIGITADGFKIFEQELEKKLSEEDKEKLSYLEGRIEVEESAIGEIFKILDKYYVYSEEALLRKEKTSANTAVNADIGKDIMENYNLTNKIDLLKNIPILVAQGSHDILNPHLIHKLLIEHIPHAELEVIENCGHWTVVEKPNEMMKIASRFFGCSLT